MTWSKYISLMALMAMAVSVQAQNTFLNDRLTSVDQLNGSARFVGMGGAMGALGADLSTIASNPAGIGLYRRSDVGLSFGAVIPDGNGWDMNHKSSYGENLSRASFDQFGAVFSLNTDNSSVKFVNFAFNYQKKLNFNQGFFANNNSLGGLSQMTQLAQMATDIYTGANRDAEGELTNVPNNLTGLVMFPKGDDPTADAYYLNRETDAEGNVSYYNEFPSATSNYTRHQRGALKSYDMNVSLNVNDRFYFGATLGLDRLDYTEWNEYAEYGSDGGLNHSLYNDVDINGTGLNGKLGIIVRPIEASSLRFGLAVETPTWYRLNNSTLYNLDQSDRPESYLEYTLRTPWKTRLSAGHTVGSKFAWGVEYEFANYSKTVMGYPSWDAADPNHSMYVTAERDQAMNRLTAGALRGQHTLRAGVEVKPLKRLAVRAGYNYISNRYEPDARYDQWDVVKQAASYQTSAIDYATNTEYMRLGATNIVTLGLGYQFKRLYIDMAYQFRAQKGDFFAFDSTGQEAALQPVGVNLNRHQLQLGVGVKF